jgi:hypothetical protein
VARHVPADVVKRFGFPLEAEGAILAFVMPGWIFLVVSTLGRIPGNWVLSAQGVRTATDQYVELALLTALTAAVAIPLFYYRHAILDRLRRLGKGRPSP